ncbi:MAG: hypothetical protein IBJ10_03830 [Phycisphaerales bacterium]|nr:hypothetical protein [Phycisphaerales bacterium]
MGMSFEERSVWVQAVAMLIVLGGYFVIAGVMMSRGVGVLAAYVPLFIGAVVLMVAVLVVGHVAAALLSRDRRADERDRLIGWRAEASSSWLVGAGVIVGIGCMVAGMNDVWVAHLLLGSMFLSETLKYALQIVYYRRGV